MRPCSTTMWGSWKWKGEDDAAKLLCWGLKGCWTVLCQQGWAGLRRLGRECCELLSRVLWIRVWGKCCINTELGLLHHNGPCVHNQRSGHQGLAQISTHWFRALRACKCTPHPVIDRLWSCLHNFQCLLILKFASTVWLLWFRWSLCIICVGCSSSSSTKFRLTLFINISHTWPEHFRRTSHCLQRDWKHKSVSHNNILIPCWDLHRRNPGGVVWPLARE